MYTYLILTFYIIISCLKMYAVKIDDTHFMVFWIMDNHATMVGNRQQLQTYLFLLKFITIEINYFHNSPITIYYIILYYSIELRC